MKQKKRSPSKRKYPLVAGVGIVLSLAVVIVLGGFLIIPDEEAQPSITDEIFSYSGYTRVIEKQEYDFYEYLAQREMDDISDSKLLAQNTKELAQTANAQFYLGNKLGLHEPYSFENMQVQMKLENARRKISQEKGQAIYGPESFDIYRYYQYVFSNLEVDIIDYIARHADESMDKKARLYFEENKDKYDHPEQIVYLITENGEEEEHTIDWRQLSSLEKADSELAQFLREGGEYQQFSYNFGSIKRNVKIHSVTYMKTDFEHQKNLIVSDFLRSGYYKELLKEVEMNNPIVFAEK
ncbi:hypothetical protein [Paenibacillus antarcticus]|uniref:hypothetical protein n=1 Tax=Paenibacillus antarcticus TaxID=253703 RepID=UPI000B125D6A|nr:hypothetical protein [Paenibacillus antarcticus]